jgi:hypothetical protein
MRKFRIILNTFQNFTPLKLKCKLKVHERLHIKYDKSDVAVFYVGFRQLLPPDIPQPARLLYNPKS